MGIAQCAAAAYDEPTCISHIDKDIDMIPGEHYNPRYGERYFVSNERAMRNFFYQIIMGDRVDNIPGFDGKMRHKVPKFLMERVVALQHLPGPEFMLKHVGEMYNNEWLLLDKHARCLWIQREEDDDWLNYLNANTMEALGLKDVLTLLSQVRLEQPADAGHPSMSV